VEEYFMGVRLDEAVAFAFCVIPVVGDYSAGGPAYGGMGAVGGRDD